MAARPGGKGPTLYEVAGWIQGVVAAPFRAVGWLNRRDKPEVDRNDWRPVRVGIALGAILAALALALLTRTLLIAFGLIDGVGRWSELRNSLLVIGVIVGAPFVVWRTMIADRQTTINQQTHYTDLYTKAVEMLGADKVVKQRVEKTSSDEDAPTIWETAETTEPNIEVRLGAIYALQRIMTQSDTDYLPILKTLCAYVRENATFQEEPTDEDGDPLPELPDLPKGRDETAQELTERLGAIYLYANNLQSWGERLRQKAAARGEKSAQRPDIRAALDVLCERPKKGRLALGGIDSVYQRTLDLSETPEDRTTEARRCRLDLAAAALQGAARWGADLRWANLGEARMEGADLSEARMERAHLVNAQMQGAVLSRAQMQGADLFMARMEGARLVRAQMQGAVLTGARMQGAILIMVRMQAADLRFARMEGADLSGAWMERADLRFTHMEGANLSEARMQSADMDNADFRAAVVTSANFTDTKNLTYDQLASAFGDAATRLPPDLDAMRQRLIAEAGWAKDETPLLEIEQRYVAWRAQRSL